MTVNETMPEAVSIQQGLHKGWRKWYNYDTYKGRYGVFVTVIGLYYLVYKVTTVTYNRNKVLAARQAEKDKKDLFEKQVQAWVKNGRKFD